MITALEEMGHKQPATGTPLKTNNSTDHGILHAQVRMKKSKAFDMRYHWLKDRIAQKQFNLYCAPGKLNTADRDHVRLVSFWCCTLLGLTFTYRVWFDKHCDCIDVLIVKEVGQHVNSGHL